MTSTRRIVRLCCMCRSHCVSLVNQLYDLLFRAYEVLSEALYLDLLILVLEDLEHFMVVEQVIYFTAIDFIHGNSHGEVSLIVLPVVNASFK